MLYAIENALRLSKFSSAVVKDFAVGAEVFDNGSVWKFVWGIIDVKECQGVVHVLYGDGFVIDGYGTFCEENCLLVSVAKGEDNLTT